MLDIAAALGSGWQIDARERVTVSNQDQFAVGLDEGCALRNVGVFIGKVNGDVAYAPPLGWEVVYVSRQRGSAGAPLYDHDDLWVSPEGKIWSTSDCVGAGYAQPPKTTNGGVTITPQKTSHVWLFVAAIGALVIYTWMKK